MFIYILVCVRCNKCRGYLLFSFFIFGSEVIGIFLLEYVGVSFGCVFLILIEFYLRCFFI